MANEYLKPQIPLKDLNSENYFYPLTTLDQIIIGNSRLSAYFSENDGKLIFNNIDEDSVGGNVKLDGITTNRTLFVENDSLLSSENIFINNDSLAINKTSITDGYKFEVNGNSYLNGRISSIHGIYTATEDSRYEHSALEIRENDLVGTAQTDIGYAPTIGFHWSGRVGSTLSLGSDGIFYFRKQNGLERSTINAFLPNTSHGDDTADTTSYSWHKVASVIIKAAYHDRWIKLSITNGYSYPHEMGILLARVRVSGELTLQNADLVWLVAGSSIRLDSFKLVYYNETNQVRAELWYQVQAQYQGVHFTIIDQGARGIIQGEGESDWQLTERLWGHGQASCPTGSGSVNSGTTFLLNTVNQARYLENRGGSTVSINDAVWNHGETPPGHANRATVWHQRWTQSGLTYTPSGGSATALTDCGDIIYWLSSSTTANELMLNIAIDGLIRAKHGHFLNRLYCNEWIQFSGNTGLYFPNSGSGTYFLPANNCSYGSFQINGSKGGYYGITSGPDNNYLTLMSGTQHQGLYNTATGMWVLYYDKTNKRIGIYGSAVDSSWPVRINANTRINNSLLVAYDQNGTIWCGQNKDTAHGEHDIGVASGAGRLYIYSQAAANGGRGLYGSNNAGTNASYLSIAQDNHIRTGVRIYGAVWNDYAEFRKGQMDNLKPGQIVAEVGNGNMKLANQRLQKGCKILSDTYGFALGETTEYKLPIAVSGRVLVYCDTPNEELEPGDCLCANYTGNAIKMTQEEIIKYPDRIIGTVSEFPDYEVWHAGDQTDPNGMKEEIKVNGRIWVYVR